MQHNTAEIHSKSSRSPENATQQPSTSTAHYARLSNNPRFIVTPETLGTSLHLNPTASATQPQPQHSVFEMKSYYERHNKSAMRIMSGCMPESNSSCHSSHSNTPTSSCFSLKGENMGHCLSSNPNINNELIAQSPSQSCSPKSSQSQWNFERNMNNEQLNVNIPVGNNSYLQTMKGAGELTGQHLIATSVRPHAHCAYFQNATTVPELPLINEQHLQKYRSGSDISNDDSAKLNFKNLNDIYVKRIEDIDVNAWGDKDLKIFTYQEWVDILAKVNESFIDNMEELEKEVAGRLELVQRRATGNCRHSQGNELMKCRKDIDVLLKYIRNIPNIKKWDIRDLTLETLTPDQVLEVLNLDNLTIEHNGGEEIKDYNDDDFVQKNKLYTNMKALAQEVAEKHDEVRELKRQVICLEDEIQKAQKKIQLKDDVIKELRNEIKCGNNKISSNTTLDQGLPMPPINYENQTSRSSNTQITDNASTFQADNGSQFESLSHVELEEQNKIKLLQDEIYGLFEISELSKQKAEHQREKIMEVIERQESEKAAANRRLDFIHKQLIDLESESNEGKSDCDSGFHSKSENNHDAKLIDGVRQNLRKRNETICELKKKLHKLEVEKNEMSTILEAKKLYSERSNNTLKEVADLLCSLTGKEFFYTDIYNSKPNQENPFCQFIAELHENYKRNEAHLMLALGTRNKQNEELSKLLSKHEKEYNDERVLRANFNNFDDNDNTPAVPLFCISSPTPPVTTSSTVTVSSPTSAIGQELDNTIASPLHRLVDK